MSMRNQRRRPPQRIGDLLPALASQLGLEEELKAAHAMSSWRRVVEELVPSVGDSVIVEIRPPTLVVSADDAASAQELRLWAGQLLGAFAAVPGGTRLLELKVVVRAPGTGLSGQPR